MKSSDVKVKIDEIDQFLREEENRHKTVVQIHVGLKSMIADECEHDETSCDVGGIKMCVGCGYWFLSDVIDGGEWYGGMWE